MAGFALIRSKENNSTGADSGFAAQGSLPASLPWAPSSAPDADTFQGIELHGSAVRGSAHFLDMNNSAMHHMTTGGPVIVTVERVAGRAGNDDRVAAWAVPEGAPVGALPELIDQLLAEGGVAAIKVNHYGTVLAVGAADSVDVYHIDRQRKAFNLLESYCINNRLSTILFLGDGSRISLGFEDGGRQELPLPEKVQAGRRELHRAATIAAPIIAA